MSKIFNQDVAMAFYTNDKYVEDLIFHTGYSLFYIYENGHYRRFSPKDFTTEVMRFIRKEFPRQNWTVKSVEDIVKWIEHECPRQVDHEDGYYVGFKDCLYNTRTFETEPHDKKHIVTYYLDYNFSDIENFETPVFDKFLETTLTTPDGKTHDNNLTMVVQEMFGSLFIDNLKASKAFFLYGETGQNGKSTITHLIRKVVGKDFTSALSLTDLSKQFGLSALIGKKANVADELDDKFGSSKMFKQLVSGDPVTDRHIYGEQFTLYNRAKFFYSTNVMLTFDGIDGGLRRRLMIIPFYREFKDEDPDKDYMLDEKLEKEIPGIIHWALVGAKRLVENSYRFSKSEATVKMLQDFEDEASTAVRYFRDNLVMFASDVIWEPLQKIYDDYLSWCSEEGAKRPTGKKKFLKDIKGIWGGIKTKAMRLDPKDFYYHDGKQVVCVNCTFKDNVEIINNENEPTNKDPTQPVLLKDNSKI